MKYFVWTIVVAASMVLIIRIGMIKTYETMSTNAIKEMNRAQEKDLEKAEINKQEAWNRETVKVWVRAKDTKTCMRILNLDVLNNEVAECNKDRYVSMRRDEVENFKKEQGL